MDKYRIVRVDYHNETRYEAQKRFLGFLWWYNFNDETSSWNFKTIEEAKKSIDIDRYKTKRSVVETFK